MAERLTPTKNALKRLTTVILLMLATGQPVAASTEPETTEADSLMVNSSETVPREERKIPDIWSIQAGATASYMIHAGPDIQAILHSFWASHYDIRLKWRQAKENTSPYDRALNRPIIQGGLLLGDFSRTKVYREESAYHSTIGRMWTLYGGMQLELAAGDRWGVGADLQNGISYCTDPYNEHDNADNNIIGSHFSLYVNLGLYARYRMTRRWHIALNIDFKHYSNGSLDRPNLGINAIGPTLALQYDIQPPTTDDNPDQEKRIIPAAQCQSTGQKLFNKKIYTDFMAGLGMKALIDGFNVHHSSHNPVYGFPTVMIAPMYHYHLAHATGIGIDYTYADYVYKIKEYDRILGFSNYDYSPHILGLSLRHEVFYRSFSLNVGLGYCLIKKTGHSADTNESKAYQHVALRYSLPFTGSRFYLGYNVKAYRFQKVDCIQLIAGYRIGW